VSKFVPWGLTRRSPVYVAVLDHLETGLDVDDLGPSVDPDFAEHLGGGVDDRDIVDDVAARASDQHLFALVTPPRRANAFAFTGS